MLGSWFSGEAAQEARKHAGAGREVDTGEGEGEIARLAAVVAGEAQGGEGVGGCVGSGRKRGELAEGLEHAAEEQAAAQDGHESAGNEVAGAQAAGVDAVAVRPVARSPPVPLFVKRSDNRA